MPPGASAAAPCIACGASCRLAFSKGEFQILRCEACGLGRVEPLPTRAELTSYYASSYYDSGPAGAGYRTDYRELEAGLKRAYRRLLDRVTSRRHPEGFRRVLDVGCAYGYFLDVVEQRWHPSELVGVDVTEEAQRRAESAGRAFHRGFFEDVELPEAHFDLVYLGDAFEHVRDPAAVSDKLVRVLAPGGVLVLTTVDFGSPLARLLGRRWRLLSPPEHLHFWTRASVERMFRERGLSGGTANYWLFYPKSYVYQRTRQQFGIAPRFLALWPGSLIPVPSFDALLGIFRKAASPRIPRTRHDLERVGMGA